MKVRVGVGFGLGPRLRLGEASRVQAARDHSMLYTRATYQPGVVRHGSAHDLLQRLHGKVEERRRVVVHQQCRVRTRPLAAAHPLRKHDARRRVLSVHLTSGEHTHRHQRQRDRTRPKSGRRCPTMQSGIDGGTRSAETHKYPIPYALRKMRSLYAPNTPLDQASSSLASNSIPRRNETKQRLKGPGRLCTSDGW